MKRRFISALALCCLFASACAAVPEITQTQAASAPGSAPAVLPHVDGESGETAEPAVVPGMSRDQAIVELTEVAFLAYSDATCVIDALFDQVGVYDFTSQVANEQANQPELIRVCLEGPAVAQEAASAATAETNVTEPSTTDPSDQGGDIVDQATTSTDGLGTGEEVEADGEVAAEATSAETESDPADAVEAAEAQPAALQATFAPGAVATGAVDVAGIRLGYAVVTPSGFQAGDPAPVLINLPDNGVDLDTTRSFTEAIFLDAALAQGWVVISPTLSGVDWIDPRSSAVVSGLADWVETWVAIEGGRPHIGGFGGGGSGAFVIAAQNPGSFRSLTVSPGLPPAPLDVAVEALVDLPVRMWVVNNEGNPWITGMRAADEALRAEGGDAVLYVLTVEEVIAAGGDPALGRAILNEIRSLG